MNIYEYLYNFMGLEAKVKTRLRSATHPYHVRINQHPLLVGLSSPEYLISSYRTVLVAYFHLYERIESRINQYLKNHHIPFDYNSRQKLSWIKDDLGFFQEDPLSEINCPAAPIEFPEIESIGQLIGVLYPIEGSTLGGQVISRHLQLNHGLTPNQGASFFNGYAEETADRWENFCQFSESIQSNTEQCELAEATAILAFNKFEETLNDYHRSRS